MGITYLKNAAGANCIEVPPGTRIRILAEIEGTEEIFMFESTECSAVIVTEPMSEDYEEDYTFYH